MITSWIEKLKEKRRKEKEYKKHEKEMMKKIEEEEKEIEKDLPPESSFSWKETVDILFGEDEEDKEYEELLTEEELEEEKVRKKEEKRLYIIVASVFTGVIVFVVVGMNIFYNFAKNDLLKITQPKMEEYYQARYNKEAEITDIHEITYTDEERNVVPTGIYLATTKDNKHIISVENKLIGDDIGITNINKEAKEYIETYVTNLNVITDDVELSYKDYYIEFNRYLDYINALPSNMTLDALINSGKLTVTYKLIYQGDINDYEFLDLISKFSDESRFYLIKHESGKPTNIKIVRKDLVWSIDVTNEKPLDDGITEVELARTLNNVKSVDITKVAKSAESSKGDYGLANGIIIKPQIQRNGRDETIVKTSYYLLKLASNTYSSKSIVQMNTRKRTNSYEEIEKAEYQNTIIIDVGGYTYLLGTNEIHIATKTAKKEGFLCNFGLC